MIPILNKKILYILVLVLIYTIGASAVTPTPTPTPTVSPTPTITPTPTPTPSGLTDKQLNAVMGIITNFILSSDSTSAPEPSIVPTPSPSKQELAIEKISNYADSSNNAPTLQDYIDAGVTGVTSTNLNDINQAVKNTNSINVDTVAEIQALINTIINISPYIGDSPTSSLEEAKKSHTIGRIIPIEEVNITTDSLIAYNGVFEALGLIEDDDNWQTNIFLSLNKMINDKKISGYRWDYSELMISYPDGRQEFMLFSSSQEER